MGLTKYWLSYPPSTALEILNDIFQTTFSTLELRLALGYNQKAIVFDNGHTLRIDLLNATSIDAQIVEKLQSMVDDGQVSGLQCIEFGWSRPVCQRRSAQAVQVCVVLTVGSWSLEDSWLAENIPGVRNARTTDDSVLLKETFGALGEDIASRLRVFNRDTLGSGSPNSQPESQRIVEVCRDTIQFALKGLNSVFPRDFPGGLIAYVPNEPDNGIIVMPMDLPALLLMKKEGRNFKLTVDDVEYYVPVGFVDGEIELDVKTVQGMQLVSHLFHEDGRQHLRLLEVKREPFQSTGQERPLLRDAQGDFRDSPAAGFQICKELYFVP